MLLSSDTCMYTCAHWVYWDHSPHLLERVLCLFVTSLLSAVIEPFKMLSWLYGQCKNQSKTYFSWDDRGIFGYKMEFHAFLLGFFNCSFKNIFFFPRKKKKEHNLKFHACAYRLDLQVFAVTFSPCASWHSSPLPRC